MAKSKASTKAPAVTVTSNSTVNDQSIPSQIVQPASVQTLDQSQLTFFNSVTEMIKTEVSKARQQIKNENASQLRKSIKEIQKRVDTFEKGRRESEIKLFEALAVFVALFSYIAVNISIFNRVENLNQALWFMVVMLFAFVGFLAVFSVILREKTATWTSWIPTVIILVLLCVVAYFSPLLPMQRSSNVQSAAAQTPSPATTQGDKVLGSKDGK